MRKRIAIAGALTITILVGLYLISRLGVKTYVAGDLFPEGSFSAMIVWAESADGEHTVLKKITEGEIRQILEDIQVSTGSGLQGAMNLIPENLEKQDSILIRILDQHDYLYDFRFYRNGVTWFSYGNSSDLFDITEGSGYVFDDGACFRALEGLFKAQEMNT